MSTSADNRLGGEQLVTVRGLDLRVSITGSGPPLLMITGIGATMDLLQPLRAELESDHELVAFDAPGVGGSSTPRLPLTMAGIARVAITLLDRLGYEQVDAIGVSFGGALAQQLAKDAPARVRRLVLASTGCGIGALPGRAGALFELATPTRYYSSAYWANHAPRLYGGRVAREPRIARRLGNLWPSRPPSPRGYLWQLAAISTWTSLPWLSGIRQPTLVMHGDDDPLVPLVNGRFLACRIPNAQLHIVKGGGHLLLVDDARRSAEVIRQFLR
jgi:poly(3-hydroxyalkanoate) depolymerase